MKSRLLFFLGAVCALAVGALAADTPADAPAGPVFATTITSAAIKIGNGSFPLPKGTKLEVVARDGDTLTVKFRNTQGKIPLTSTNFDPDTELPEPAAPAAPAKPAVKPAPAATPLPAVAKQTAGQTPGGQQATPPALSVDGKPASNYGKMVQKAKQVEQAHNDKLVKPSDEVLDDAKPKK